MRPGGSSDSVSPEAPGGIHHEKEIQLSIWKKSSPHLKARHVELEDENLAGAGVLHLVDQLLVGQN